MRVFSRSARAAIVTALLTMVPVAAQAQTSMTVACDAGVGCTTLQFNLFSTNALSLNNLTLNLSGGVWRFVPPAGLGAYIASDDAGAFGGFSALNADGSSAVMDFVGGVGFTFELAAGSTGLLQLEGSSDNTDGLVIDYVGDDANGGQIRGRYVIGGQQVVPEPATVALLASGMLALAVVARRRRQS